MPISAIDLCSESHWSDVRAIIEDAVQSAGFNPNLVSDADEVGIIQKRIVQNLYENPIVVCDVSCKNPNVMFELGMRLAFDKPTVIIKDDKTTYSFDTSPIEHLTYPRDLRFAKIVEFKQNLADKVKRTYEASRNDPNYTTFLKHFGQFTVAKIGTKEISKDEYIVEELKDIRNLISRLVRPRVGQPSWTDFIEPPTSPETWKTLPKLQNYLSNLAGEYLSNLTVEYLQKHNLFTLNDIKIDFVTRLTVDGIDVPLTVAYGAIDYQLAYVEGVVQSKLERASSYSSVKL